MSLNGPTKVQDFYHQSDQHETRLINLLVEAIMPSWMELIRSLVNDVELIRLLRREIELLLFNFCYVYRSAICRICVCYEETISALLYLIKVTCGIQLVKQAFVSNFESYNFLNLFNDYRSTLGFYGNKVIVNELTDIPYIYYGSKFLERNIEYPLNRKNSRTENVKKRRCINSVWAIHQIKNICKLEILYGQDLLNSKLKNHSTDKESVTKNTMEDWSELRMQVLYWVSQKLGDLLNKIERQLLALTDGVESATSLLSQVRSISYIDPPSARRIYKVLELKLLDICETGKSRYEGTRIPSDSSSDDRESLF